MGAKEAGARMSELTLRALDDTALSVLEGDVELLRYTYAPTTPQLESPKPFLHPIRTRSDRIVSLFRPHDHVWHKGIAWSLPVVGDENFWGGPTYVHGRFYVQLDNDGSQVHRGAISSSVDGSRASFGHDLDWVTQHGNRLFTEHRSLTVSLVERDAWVLIFETTMRNVSGGAIAIGSPTTRGRENAGYGGLFWRGPRSFTGGTLVTTEGRGGDDLRGWRGEWMAFVGSHDGEDGSSVVLMVDDAANPHHPPQWFARSEEFACLNPAPFFSQELVIADGDEASFRYGTGIADGDESDAPPLADLVRKTLRGHG